MHKLWCRRGDTMAEPLTGTPAVLSQWLIPEGRCTNLTLLLPTSQELEHILCLDSLSSSLCPGLLITSKDALSEVRGERGRGKGTDTFYPGAQGSVKQCQKSLEITASVNDKIFKPLS